MKLLLENWQKYLNEEVIHKNVLDETFLHFTTPERAENIVQMKKLLRAPENVVKFGTDTIDAVSLIWGEYVPGVQTTHYGENAELVGVQFETDVPPSYGYVEEVKWHLDELPIRNINILSFDEAVQRLKNASEKIDEMDRVEYETPT
jgi:hypothetical protein